MKNTVVKLTLLCVGLVFASLILASRSFALDMTGVVAVWLLDEGTGDKVADSSGNGHDGAVASGSPQWVAGKFGKALSFNGRNDWVEMNDPVVGTTVDFTIGCWVNPGATQKTWTNILSSHQEPPRRGISFEQIENNVNKFGVAAGDGTNWGWPGVQAQLKDGVWNYLVAVREGTKARVYLDGQAIGEGDFASNAPIVAATSKFRIGNWVLGGREFNGMVDEAFLFKRALSADEVKSITDRGLEGAQPVSPLDKVATSWGKIKNQD